MRLTSEIFASLLVRRVFSDGGFATVERRGAAAAGAVFVLARDRSGGLRLFTPAPQSLASEEGDRRFVEEQVADETALRARLARELRFDPDVWTIEIETDRPETYLSIADPD